MGIWGVGRRKQLKMGGKWKLLCRKKRMGRGAGKGRRRVGEAKTIIEGILYWQAPTLGRKLLASSLILL